MCEQKIIVTKKSQEAGRFIPKNAAVSYLTDSLTGLLAGNDTIDSARAERLEEKYEV